MFNIAVNNIANKKEEMIHAGGDPVDAIPLRTYAVIRPHTRERTIMELGESEEHARRNTETVVDGPQEGAADIIKYFHAVDTAHVQHTIGDMKQL